MPEDTLAAVRGHQGPGYGSPAVSAVLKRDVDLLAVRQPQFRKVVRCNQVLLKEFCDDVAPIFILDIALFFYFEDVAADFRWPQYTKWHVLHVDTLVSTHRRVATAASHPCT